MMKKYLFLLCTCLLLLNTKAQKLDSLTLDTLHDAELKLMGLSEQMVTSRDEETRLTSAKYFIRTLVRTLHVKGSYFYPFDSLKSVSLLSSPDDLFRIITWNIATNDENFRYFGVIQLNPLKTKRIKDTTNLRPYYPLIDRSDSIKNPFYAEVDQEHWWGAMYYKIIRTTTQKGTFYTLLGWDGATSRSNKKLVDVLSFKNNKPVFGAPLFDIDAKEKLYRMIWEFTNSASITLRYEEKRKILVYENIVPPKPGNEGMYETYVPDGSYDYMIWKNGTWKKQKEMLKDFKME